MCKLCKTYKRGSLQGLILVKSEVARISRRIFNGQFEFTALVIEGKFHVICVVKNSICISFRTGYGLYGHLKIISFQRKRECNGSIG